VAVGILWMMVLQMGHGDAKALEVTTRALVTAMREHGLVAFGERHRLKEVHQFYLHLLGDAEFRNTVDDIVLEFANARYQAILDDYIAGGEVSETALAVVWRDHTCCLLQTGDDPLLLDLLRQIRTINTTQGFAHRIRVLAGDPPIDWQTLRDGKAFWAWIGRRDRSYLRVVWDEVIDKGRRGFLIMGKAHFQHDHPKPPNYVSIVDVLDRKLPKPLYLVHLYTGRDPLPVPVGTLIPQARWSGLEMDALQKKLGGHVDALLYLGESGQLTNVAARPFEEPGYLKELNRRSLLVHGEPYRPSIDGVLSYLAQTDGLAAAVTFFANLNPETETRYDMASIYLREFAQRLRQASHKDLAGTYLRHCLRWHPANLQFKAWLEMVEDGSWE